MLGASIGGPGLTHLCREPHEFFAAQQAAARTPRLMAHPRDSIGRLLCGAWVALAPDLILASGTPALGSSTRTRLTLVSWKPLGTTRPPQEHKNMSLTIDAAVLRDACALLSSPARWTCGAWARDSIGEQCSPLAPQAAPMVRVGSIAKICLCTDRRQRRIAQSC